MKYICECSLENFVAWSGGKDTLDVLIEKNDCDAVESFIEEIMSCDVDGIWSETAVNDFLWFERDTIAEHLGYRDWDEYEYGDEEDDEDDEDKEDEEDED